MNRFFGMMPTDEINRESRFDVGGRIVTIQAGENGWTIIYADGSTEYEDVQATTDANFDSAFAILAGKFDSVIELTDGPAGEA